MTGALEQTAPDGRMIIGGEPVTALDGRTYATANPYTGAPWAEAADAGERDVDLAVTAAKRALEEGAWGAMTGAARGRALNALADVLDEHAGELARIESTDNGKLIRETSAQTATLGDWYRYFAGLADKCGGETPPMNRTSQFAYTLREPCGVVAMITPWNSPLQLLAWKLAPALAAGCTVVVKPSEHTPMSTLAFASLCADAGLPGGVVNVVTGNGPDAGRALVEHPDVARVAFTGSVGVGAEVAAAAGRGIKSVSLELGGKSPQLLFDDCEVEAAANGIMAGVFAASGQTCIAGSRAYVHESIHDEVVARLAQRAREIVLGDPLDFATEMGPLANRLQFERVTGFLERAAAAGAVVATGGGAAPEAGELFVRPTVLTGVDQHAEIVREEVFGPVVAVQSFATEDEAVALANDTRYGLAAGVWTSDVGRAHRVAHRLRAGTVWINCYRLVGPEVPFGGVGASGVGRENGAGAIEDFTEVKAIWVQLDAGTRDPFTIG